MAAEHGTGVVTFYNPKANFGFIDPDDASGDVVFTMRPGEEGPEVGAYVEYDIMPMPTVTQIGKQALNVRRAGSRPTASTAVKPVTP